MATRTSAQRSAAAKASPAVKESIKKARKAASEKAAANRPAKLAAEAEAARKQKEAFEALALKHPDHSPLAAGNPHPKRRLAKKANALAEAAAKLRAAQDEMEAALKAAEPGRPTMYRQEFAARATDLCMLGLTNKELGERFNGADEMTVEFWIKSIPEFARAVYEGREGADAKVMRAAFSAATGYEHPEDDIRTVSLGGDRGSEIVITPTVKHYPPNYNFANLILINRQRHRYPHRDNAGSGNNGGGSGGSPQEQARAARAAIAAAMAEVDNPALSEEPKQYGEQQDA